MTREEMMEDYDGTLETSLRITLTKWIHLPAHWYEITDKGVVSAPNWPGRSTCATCEMFHKSACIGCPFYDKLNESCHPAYREAKQAIYDKNEYAFLRACDKMACAAGSALHDLETKQNAEKRETKKKIEPVVVPWTGPEDVPFGEVFLFDGGAHESRRVIRGLAYGSNKKPWGVSYYDGRTTKYNRLSFEALVLNKGTYTMEDGSPCGTVVNPPEKVKEGWELTREYREPVESDEGWVNIHGNQGICQGLGQLSTIISEKRRWIVKKIKPVCPTCGKIKEVEV